jgi:hypothetical protein
MESTHDTQTRLDEALEHLGYAVTEGSAQGVFKVATPDGSDAGELSLSDCWALLRERHRSLFESNPPIWDEDRYGPFRLTFSGFCPECGYGIFNGRHACPEQ